MLKACPFCGHKLDHEDSDTIHPSGVGWKPWKGARFRHYVSYLEVPQEQWCWEVHCDITAGGCGASISGDSQEEAIARWNRRQT